jgi:hypothetical protein
MEKILPETEQNLYESSGPVKGNRFILEVAMQQQTSFKVQ